MRNTPHPQAPCVFLDRDGTVIHNRHYLSDPDGLELLPGAAQGLALLHGLGCPLVLLTNQSGIGRGYFDHAAVRRVHARLKDMLAAQGAPLDGIMYCPHAPEDGCACRKPGTGLALQAVRQWPCLNLKARLAAGRVVMVGDNPCDVMLGHALGGKAVLVRTGGGAALEARLAAALAAGPCARSDGEKAGSTPEECCLPPHYVADGLDDAARWIARAFGLKGLPGSVPTGTP